MRQETLMGWVCCLDMLGKKDASRKKKKEKQTESFQPTPMPPPLLPFLAALKALYPLPRKNLTRAPKPTQSDLDQFYASISGSREAALSTAAFHEFFLSTFSSDQGEGWVRWQLGAVGLWAVEVLDGLARKESSEGVDLSSL